MDWHNLALFTATEAALSLSPGPAVMVVIACAMARGWRTSLWAAAGILSGNAVYFALSASGIGALLLTAPLLFHTLRYGGAAYLIYLGACALLGRPSALTLPRAADTPRTSMQIYRAAMLLQLSNPKGLLMFVSILPQFIDPQAALAGQMLILAACSMIPEFFILLAYGMLAGKLGQHATAPRYALITERIAGTLVLTAGVVVALL
ncbi:MULTISPECIES: LysE family translocator [unclassified Undibacterium]|uniref:LysE family translocator n=1 Tax=unclassified Undibacterium TaxID=2630295 RepID=UPI002AC963DE|nr:MULTISPECIES: LysE family translocator [unclassified Undibacterium]MEB0139153.1 LysE family translocator [Undibacterium sp. CCC2.1]MEB0172867.1 LysE family translocator [Undibacterium sp. CCC1.1]MEB0176661.1 LysE family translocator [Undibacterium sp. CCC3.4]MEB0216011.1 LysE family translocator [Undibacterium sp. 5I2]WPX43147.1 LysE family translocator [Undibacterium sp. CCC3.4]